MRKEERGKPEKLKCREREMESGVVLCCAVLQWELGERDRERSGEPQIQSFALLSFLLTSLFLLPFLWATT
jgi:hypothetical protein